MKLPQILSLKHPETLGSKDFHGINCSRFRVMQGLGKDRVWGLGFIGKEKISVPSTRTHGHGAYRAQRRYGFMSLSGLLQGAYFTASGFPGFGE